MLKDLFTCAHYFILWTQQNDFWSSTQDSGTEKDSQGNAKHKKTEYSFFAAKTKKCKPSTNEHWSRT